MKAKVIKIFFSVVLLLGLSCKNEPTKTEHRAIKLTAEDASCIEAWLRIEVWTKPSTVILQKGDSTIATLQLTTMDTVIVDEGLQPSQTYRYTAQLITPIPPVWLDDELSSQVEVRTMDTTSHDFRWEIYTLGDGTGSSCLYDVAIINDTLAYAVGEIYQDYNKDYQIYNAAKWNGRGWELMRVPFVDQQGGQWITPIHSIFAFGPNDIWFEGGIHWDGTKFNSQPMNIEFPSHVNKLWGTSSRDLYAVGNNGLIAHYDGSRWRRIESGTKLNIYDIYGVSNEILAVASDIGVSFDRKILKVNGTSVISINDSPITYCLQSIWFASNGYYYVVGDGIFRKKSLSENLWKSVSYDIFTTIRGNSRNDIFAAGIGGRIMHYNGVTWINYQGQTGLSACIYGSLAMKGNLVIGVGYNSNKGCVAIGRR